MTVVGFDPFLSAERRWNSGSRASSRLDELWPRCDFLTLHTPMTAETRNIVGADAIALDEADRADHQLRPRRLIDESALLEALNAGKVAGAAIDVFDPEPPPADHPLVKHPSVLVTPHLGASTEEAQVSRGRRGRPVAVDFLNRARSGSR